MFAILQQLGLIRSSQLLPTLRSFIPFSLHSPLQLPSIPLRPSSTIPWVSALLRSAAPMAVILFHGKVKFLASRILYRHIYTVLPRPTGESMFSGLQESGPTTE